VSSLIEHVVKSKKSRFEICKALMRKNVMYEHLVEFILILMNDRGK
jgi:hypothetical protein